MELEFVVGHFKFAIVQNGYQYANFKSSHALKSANVPSRGEV